MSERRDAVVIGSGAGGGVMAYELARRGLDVTVIEAGPRWNPTTFVHDEVEMFARTYKHGGLQTTKDNGMLIIQGASVGGSTAITNAIFVRADLDRILPSWAEAGAHVPRAALERAYAELERALHVSPMPPAVAQPRRQRLPRRVQGAGHSRQLPGQQPQGLHRLHWCNYGCRYNRKTSMLVTYIPWAEGRGAQVLDRCMDVEVRVNGRTVQGVRFVRDGRPREIDVMVGTDPTGVVTLDRRKRVQICLSLSERDMQRLVRGLKTLSRIYLAGGAQRAFPSSYELLEFADEGDLDQLERRICRADDLPSARLTRRAATR